MNIGHQDKMCVFKHGCRRPNSDAERILQKIVEGEPDLELSDDERNEEEEFEPGEKEEDDTGGSDEQTDRDEQERRCPLWARSST